MGVIRVKPGVQFSQIAPGGFRILAALVDTAAKCNHDITITSACDGEHSGPDDPHHRGEAYDIRSHDLPDPQMVLAGIRSFLGDAFFAFLEDPLALNEHIHVQVRKNSTYPPIVPADLSLQGDV
jgi:hypothetical protein